MKKCHSQNVDENLTAKASGSDTESREKRDVRKGCPAVSKPRWLPNFVLHKFIAITLTKNKIWE